MKTGMKRIAALLLSLVMVFTALPAMTFAEETATYNLVTEGGFVMGKTYLIVNGNDGAAQALTNTNNPSGFGLAPVTISGGAITSSELGAAEWKAIPSTSETNIGLQNGGQVLKIKKDSGKDPTIFTNGTSYGSGAFTYTTGQHIQYPYSSVPYYIGSADGSFIARDSETGLGAVYLFVKDEPEPVVYTYEKATALEAGGIYLIVNNANRALTNSRGTSGTVGVTVSNDKIVVSGLENAEWEAYDLGSGHLGLRNAGYNLKLTSSNSPYFSITTSAYQSGSSGFEYTTGKHLKFTKENSTSVYYFMTTGSGTSSGFKSGTNDADSTHDIFIYKKVVAAVAAESVSLDPTTLTLIEGRSATLTATVSPSNTTDRLTWSSSDETVATVESGVVTAVATGSTTITVTTESGISAQCEVTVNAVEMSTYQKVTELTSTGIYLIVNETEKYALTNAKSSSNVGSVSVNISNDTIIASGLGSAEWTASEVTGGTVGLINDEYALKLISQQIGSVNGGYSAEAFKYTENHALSYKLGTGGYIVRTGQSPFFKYQASDADASHGVALYKKVVEQDEPEVIDTEYEYVWTNKLEGGKTYLIVDSKSDGSAHAMANANTGMDTNQQIPVTYVDVGSIQNEKIAASSALEAAEWTSTGETNGGVGLWKGDYVLKLSSSTGAYTNRTTYGETAFAYTSDGVLSYKANGSGGFLVKTDSEPYFTRKTNNISSSDSVYLFVKTETTSTTGTSYVAFTSDVHNGNDHTAADRLDNWITNVSGAVGSSFEQLAICGDLADATASESNYWSYARNVISVVTDNSHVGNGIYTTGNHEYNPGNFGSTTSSFKDSYTRLGKAVETGNYVVYCFGAASSSQSFDTGDIEKLDSYLSTAPANKPIFILSHFPIHSYKTRSTTNASQVLALLNTYSDPNGANLDIYFIWGHNHSEKDTNYDKIITDKIGDDDISFTYCAAGCMCDSEYYNNNSVAGKGLVAKIEDGKVKTLTYYGTSYTPTYTYEVVDVPDVEPEYVYTLTDRFELGKTYLIVNGNSGAAEALTNTSDSSFGRAAVTVSGNMITSVDNAALWEARETKTDSGRIGLWNGGKVLKVSSTPAINTSSNSYSLGGFRYSELNHVVYPYSDTEYYIGADSSNGFTASASETDLAPVYLFVKTLKPVATETKIKTMSVTVGQDLTATYLVTLASDVDPADVYMKFTRDDRIVTVKDCKVESNGYRFTYTGINPQCMAYKIKAELWQSVENGEDAMLAELSKSVADYCDLAREQNPSNTALHGLMAKMLEYGAKAQVYRNYMTSTPANAADWVAPLVGQYLEEPIPEYEPTTSGSGVGKFTSASLNLSNVVNIKFKFTLNEGISPENVTVKLYKGNGSDPVKELAASELTAENGTYIIETDGLTAKNNGTVYRVELSSSESTQSLSYTANAYLSRMQNNSNEKLANLVKALYYFGTAAEAY